MPKLFLLIKEKLIGIHLLELFFFLLIFSISNLFAQKTVSSTYVFSSGTGTYGGDLGLS